MERIFTEENLFFTNGEFKWYKDEYHNNYATSKNAENLPKLDGVGCFIVTDGNITDYVMIDDKQNIICAYDYPAKFEEYITKINMLKIAKHFDEHDSKILKKKKI